jgi:hypothetical protein
MIRLALFSPTIVASLGRFSIPQSLLLSTPRTSLLFTSTHDSYFTIPHPYLKVQEKGESLDSLPKVDDSPLAPLPPVERSKLISSLRSRLHDNSRNSLSIRQIPTPSPIPHVLVGIRYSRIHPPNGPTEEFTGCTIFRFVHGHRRCGAYDRYYYLVDRKHVGQRESLQEGDHHGHGLFLR